MVFELLMADQPKREDAHDPDFDILAGPTGMEVGLAASPARAARVRPQPSGHGGQSRCLHPLQSLRPRLPRSAGQRRHRHGVSRTARQDRVRLRRSDGRLDLRRLRRMRAGLPDRRADADDARRCAARAARRPDRKVDSVCPYCGVGCQLTYNINDDKSALRSMGRRAGQREPALRQGPLRLRLCAPTRNGSPSR